MTTDQDPKAAPEAPRTGRPQPAPFTRIPAVWGKPPPTTFRVGPLPRAAPAFEET